MKTYKQKYISLIKKLLFFEKVIILNIFVLIKIIKHGLHQFFFPPLSPRNAKDENTNSLL